MHQNLQMSFSNTRPNELGMRQGMPETCPPEALLAFQRLVYEGCDPVTGKKLGPYGIREALTQAMAGTDFTTAMSTDMTISMREMYDIVGQELGRIAIQGTLPDFNAYTVGALGGGLKPMAEEPLAGGRVADKFVDRTIATRQLRPYSKVMSYDWAAWLSDFRGILKRIPTILATSARNTVEVLLAKKLFTTTGWNITTGQGSPATTAFSLTNLEAAYVAFQAYVDPVESLPMNVRPVYLLHSPGLTINVNNVLNSVELRDPSNTGKYGISNEIARRGLIPIEAHWPNYVITSSTVKPAWWGLFSDPNVIPVLEYHYLESEPGPQIFYRAPTMLNASGQPMARSFDGNSIDVAGEVVCGANLVLEGGTTTYGCWVSNGA